MFGCNPNQSGSTPDPVSRGVCLVAMTADCKSVTHAVNTGGSIPPPTTTRDVGLAAGLQPSKLARSVQPRYVAPFHAGIAQLVERRPEEPSVSGSSPFASTRISGEVERNWCRTRLEPGESRKGRAGSIPALSAIFGSALSRRVGGIGKRIRLETGSTPKKATQDRDLHPPPSSESCVNW